MNLKKIIINIDGLARSGSTFASTVLGNLDDSLVLGETIRLGSIYQKSIGNGRYPYSMQGTFYNEGWIEKKIDLNIAREEVHIIITKYAPRTIAEEVKAAYDDMIGSFISPTYLDLFLCFNEVLSNVSGQSLVGGKTTFSHNYAGEMLERVPELKWISIVRDPRAIFLSGKAVGIYNKEDLIKTDYFYEFYNSLSNLKKRFPDRFITLRYEDGVNQPDIWRKDLEIFLGRKLGQYEKKKILHNSRGGDFGSHSSFEPDGTQLDTIKFRPLRGDSPIDRSPTNRWKTKLNIENIGLINSLYGPFIKEYDYENIPFTQKNTVNILAVFFLKNLRQVRRSKIINLMERGLIHSLAKFNLHPFRAVLKRRKNLTKHKILREL